MKSLCYEVSTNTFHLRNDAPIPEPGSGEIRVKCLATALNPVDAKVNQWKGMLSPNVDFITLGLDVCGIVDSIGTDVADISVGDVVLYHGRMFKGNGGFAEYAIHDALTTVVIAKNGDVPPANFDPIKLAATPCAAWTAHRALYDKLHLPPIKNSSERQQQDISICIVGASGGVGSFALQFAKLSGVKTIIAVCSAQHEHHVTELGATDFIDYKKEEINQGIMRITNGEGVDLILDCVGSETAKAAVKALKYDGLICPIVSFAEGDLDNFLKSHVICQVSLGAAHNHGEAARRRLQQCGRRVTDLVLENKLIVPVTKVISLEEVAETLQSMLNANTTGKIVLRL